MTTTSPLGVRSARWLATLLADVTGLAAEQFLEQAGFDELGLDSISINQFNVRLAVHIDGVPRSLLFDCRTLDDLNGYLLKHHSDALAAALDAQQPTPEPAVRETAIPETGHWPVLASRLRAEPGNTDSVPDPIAAPIAIVGLAGRYPEADDVAAFWRNLAAGRNSVRAIPEERWPLAGFYEAADNAGKKGRSYCKWGAFLDGIDRFDADFFGIPPREADTMDPQERLFLEVAWQALEDAGLHLYRTLHGRGAADGFPVSVHVGVTTQTYHLHGPSLWQRGIPVFPTSLQWSIANRVSYLLNLRGPSMPVDTACSASLTALHLACATLRAGEAEMALVGGVNLYLHPSKFVWLSQQRMVTPTGQCHSFSDDADGFVPGEGVGAVVLKPLPAALRDGNHIYGLVAATSVNHGGRTNGYTVPSPAAQAALVRAAVEAAGVEPAAVSYIEAHGTGTRLGDPVEIDGLTAAFGDRAARGTAPPCAIASTKTNIGHLESAAGIAGLTRVLLQMRHGRIAPSLNLRALNPDIDLGRSPFRIVTALEPWVPPPAAAGTLIAGISSFGAGGANAHALIASYRAPARPPAHAPAHTGARLSGPTVSPLIFPLSARTPEALSARAADLRAQLDGGDPGGDTLGDGDLAALAFTLQMAREPLPLRMAVVAASRAELLDALDAALRGQDRPNLHTGEAARKAPGAPVPAPADPQDRARAWVAGHAIDWAAGWPEPRPALLPLPPYRFGGERHWAGRGQEKAAGLPLPWAGPLPETAAGWADGPTDGPVTLDGGEAFLIQHRVGGRALLSGTTMMELARAAATRRLGACAALRDVAFLRPCAPQGPTAVEVALRPRGAEGELAFEIRSPGGELHARGIACRDGNGPRHAPPTPTTPPRNTLSGEAVYAGFRERGFDYGPSFRPLRSVRVWAGRVEAEVALPPDADRFAGRFGWHPGLLDACFQAVVPLLDQSAGSPPIPFSLVPFSLGRLEVAGPLDTVRRLIVTPGERSHLDVAMLDEAGSVVVAATDVILRPAANRDDARLSWLAPVWRPVPAPDAAVPPADVLLLALGNDPFTGTVGPELSRLTARPLHTPATMPGDARHILALAAWPEDIAATLDQLYTLCRALIPGATQGAVRLVLGYAHDGNSRADLQALHAFARTLKQESPSVTMDVVALPAESLDTPAAARALLAELAAPGDQPRMVRYGTGGRREERVFEPWTPPPPAAAAGLPALRSDAAYLVTGGAGGLGRLFARHIARRAPGCTLVLCGRRPAGAAVDETLRELAALGVRARYEQADTADAAAVRRLAAGLSATAGDPPLRGILHAAGVLHDGFILRKAPGEAAAVLAPKPTALRLLDEAFADAPLDWVVLFSSLASALGNLGQSDYAVANAALDQYAAWRNAERDRGRRRGVALSINWPLWDGGGMQVDERTRQRHIGQGIATVGEADGLAAFDTALAAALAGGAPAQLFPLTATATALDRILRAAPAPAPAPTSAPAPAPAAPRADLVPWLRELVARTLGRPVERVPADASFRDLGIDSIMVMEMNEALEERFENLSKTLFFECDTVAEVAAHLAAQMPARMPAAEVPAPPPAPPPTSVPAPAIVAPPLPARDDIAIVGLAGRYPGADDLAGFWDNLRAGRDGVTEVPPERWALEAPPPGRGKEGRYARWGSFLKDVDRFDPLFFGMSPREAERTDPQERLFLETVWHAIEEAGYTPDTLHRGADPSDRNDVGVYVGVMYGEYQYLGVEAMARGAAGLTQSSYASIANRVSYLFDFCGPSMAVDTMCSSSLTAIHLACEALRAGGCAVAVAGGVNLSLHPYKYRTLEELKFASTDGRCRSFGDGGDGYVPGEGVGAVILKPLSRALADGDHIHGVIRGSAINHGGRTNGYTVPNPNAQGRLIASAIRRSGLPAGRIGYVEAHGTGTPLGDPIEVRGLAMAFGAGAGAETGAGGAPSCALGSLKSNLGHLEAAAGIAALTKVLLQMKHRELVPTLHCDPPNPNIRFDGTPFRVQTVAAPWPAQRGEDGADLPRVAGISSFGAGGSNAHLIVEEAPVPARTARTPDGPQLAVLSARTADLLAEQARRLCDWLETGHDADRHSLRDVALTLRLGRVAHPVRLAVVAHDAAELRARLRSWLSGDGKDGPVLTGRPEDGTRPALRLAAEGGTVEALTRDARAWIAGEAGWQPPAVPFARVPLPGTVWQRRRCWLDTPMPTPSQVLHLYRQGRISHAEAMKTLQDIDRRSGAA